MHLSLRAMVGLTFLQPLLIHAQEMAMRWLHVLGSHSRIMIMGMKKLNYQQEIREENINLQEFGALCFKRQIKLGRKEYNEKRNLFSRFMFYAIKGNTLM
ncbi:hypothetical protein Dsin_022779 [Dipteronia sinensis]|uniref:Secreted protein n=1 Tax=Dipteronia sinensis TaxID=43782 RepID=A0AAE0A350_9ROSI|nr:hypothetical protein Dsin_022779 [Dipteronia sinensis]